MLITCIPEKEFSSKWAGEGQWWGIKCVDLGISPGAGYFEFSGNLESGKFYFHANGTYSRKATLSDLVDCRYPDAFPELEGGFGDIGEYYWGPDSTWHKVEYDSTWTISGNTIDINHYGSWKIIDLKDSKLVIQSSRSNFNYDYTLVAE